MKHYLCFLLRVWRTGDQDATVRALLEDPSSREIVGFASLQDLCAYLEKMSRDLEQDPASDSRRGGGWSPGSSSRFLA